MTGVSYVPGPLTAVTSDRFLLVTDAAADSPAAAWLWHQVSLGARAEELLGGLLGAGFAGGSGFALLTVVDDGEWRLFCRGAVSGTVVGPAGGQERVDGTGLRTWREHAVPAGAEQVFLGEPPADSVLRLPAATGVVLAGCVIVNLAGAPARDTGPYGPVQAWPEPQGQASAPPTVTTPTVSMRSAQAPFPAPVPVLTPFPAAGPASAPAPGAPDEAGYDFLWEATVARSVADAAIRTDDDAPGWPPAAGTAPAPWGPPVPADPPAGPPAVPPPAPVAGSAWSAPPGRGPGAGSPLGPGELIDAVPWGPAPGGEPGVFTGETDVTEFTVKRGDLGPGAAVYTPPPDRIGPAVAALICPAGHVNPPSEAACRACGASLPTDSVVVPRPVLGLLRVSTGDVISLDRDVVLGRLPRSDESAANGAERPHLVKLPSADGDISRSHVRVTLDGWHVLVTDLHSTNGTLITLPGQEAQQVRPGEPMPIRPGTVVTLAEGIDFRYEVAR